MTISTKYADNAVTEAGYKLIGAFDEDPHKDADDVIDQLAEALEPWADQAIAKIRNDHSALARLVAEVMVVQFFSDRGELLPEPSEK
jgi:hypothetical protein